MSLAGPHGEAACRYCRTLVDLGPDRKLVRHRLPGTAPARPWACPGSLTYAHTQKPELEELTFSSERIMAACPACRQEVPVNTVGVDERNRRFQAHRVGRGDGTTFYCPAGGTLVSQEAAPLTVSIQSVPGGEWRPLGDVLG